MVLNYVNTGFFTAVVLVSAVNNLQVNTRESNSRRMLTEISQNISRVQNVLEKFIKHIEQVEGIVKEYSDQTAEAVSQQNKKGKTRKHGSNIDEIDNNSRTFKFKTSEMREFTMNTSKDDAADGIVKGHRRVNENPNDGKEYEYNESFDLPKKYRSKNDAFIEENMPTTSDQVSIRFNTEWDNDRNLPYLQDPQTTNKPEPSAVPDHNSSSQEEKIAQDEILKAKSLRQAYDDACKTVIKKKCKKALETVLKDVCSPFRKKCFGKFKTLFKDSAKTGCDVQFNEKPVVCRMGHDYPELGGTAGDIEPETNDDNTKLLRKKIEKREKACNKANYKKCLAACKYAVDKTCGEYECVKQEQKAFDKFCKRRCKENYGIFGSDTSIDDGTSDDENFDDDSPWEQ